MTVQGRDCSNFDADPIDFSGLGLFTHKATEGTSVTHDKYGPRLAAARAAGVPVLGAYHVVRTPSGAGSLAAQLGFWLGYLDAHTPWWRTHPNFILQVDAEKWPYDQVSANTVLQFAALLVQTGVPAWKVTYASRGQYGDSLRGLATPLWNADYRRGPGYPGDTWSSSGGAPAGWAPYSGQTPVLLQYTSTPYDKNAYRGSLAELLTLTGGDMALADDPDGVWLFPRVEALALLKPPGEGPEKGKTLPGVEAIKRIDAGVAQLLTGAPVTLSDADMDKLAQKVAALILPAATAANSTAVVDELAKRLDNG